MKAGSSVIGFSAILIPIVGENNKHCYFQYQQSAKEFRNNINYFVGKSTFLYDSFHQTTVQKKKNKKVFTKLFHAQNDFKELYLRNMFFITINKYIQYLVLTF